MSVRYCWRCASTLPAPPPVDCGRCGQGHYNNPKPAADAVVVREGQILLIKRARDPWRNHWDIPGGFCNAGEHPIRTAQRELLEEVGLHARCEILLGVWIDEYGPPDADGVQETTLNFAYIAELLDLPAERPHDDEAIESRWFPLDVLPTQLAFPAHQRPALEAARALLTR